MSKLEEFLLVVDEPKYINEFRAMKQRAIDYVLVIEQFQKLLSVYTTTEALAKVAVLMREEDTAGKLLSKALGHLHSCSEEGSKALYNEIASAFGEAVEHNVQRTAKWSGHYETCPANNGGSCTCGY